MLYEIKSLHQVLMSLLFEHTFTQQNAEVKESFSHQTLIYGL